MFAIQKQIPDGRKRYTKDFQAALHVEDLAANFAKTGDINQLQQGLDKVHEQEQHVSHKGQQQPIRSNDNRSNDNTNSANYSAMDMGNLIRNSSAQMSGGFFFLEKISLI